MARQYMPPPRKICAVRGCLSKEHLEQNGICCPPIYGDPALLMPFFYNKKDSIVKYKLGIIPHITDLDNRLINSMVQMRNDCKLINLQRYKNWYSIIDDIMECEIIISSSLHGLILSDAYKKPNVWVRLSENVNGGDIKFRDYFSSVNRPFFFLDFRQCDNLDLNRVLECGNSYKEINIDIKPLVKSCPFIDKDVKNSILNKINNENAI